MITSNYKVGGVKKGQKNACVIFERSLSNKNFSSSVFFFGWMAASYRSIWTSFFIVIPPWILDLIDDITKSFLYFGQTKTVHCV